MIAGGWILQLYSYRKGLFSAKIIFELSLTAFPVKQKSLPNQDPCQHLSYNSL